MTHPTSEPRLDEKALLCPLCGIPAKGHDAEYLRLRASTNVMCALTEADIPEWATAERSPDDHALTAAYARCKELTGCGDIIGYGGVSLVEEIIAAYLAALPVPSAPSRLPEKVSAKLPENAEAVLVDVCQLLDGWHQDGTAWSEWDESVRKRVAALLALYRPAGETRDWSAELHALAGMECLNEDGAKGDDQYSCNQECVTCCARREVERLSAAPAGETRTYLISCPWCGEDVQKVPLAGQFGHLIGCGDRQIGALRAALPPSHAGEADNA